MARKQSARSKTGRTVLVIDDDREYLATTERLLARDGHHVIALDDPAEALALLQRERVDLVLVDFFMPQMTGEAFVQELRRFNHLVQVILQTGYASEQPPRDLLKRLDIQGYYDKSEGPDKLLLWTDVGLKAAFTVQLLEKSRLGLRYILETTPELHRVRPLDDLLRGVLVQTTGLLGAVDSFLAVLAEPPPASLASQPDAFVTLAQDSADLVVRAGTGRFQPSERIDRYLAPSIVAEIRAALGTTRPRVVESMTIMPLRVGDSLLGAIYLDRPISESRDIELLEIFANQAAVAIHNAHLYEMAALDPLTGVYTRRFFQQAFARELRNAHRSGKPLSLLVVDVDNMKRINDSGGHLRGDEALAAVGRTLRGATRVTDSVGRYGGDEFVVVLPNTPAEGAQVVVNRILAGMAGLSVESATGPLDVRTSIGVAVLAPPAEGAIRPPVHLSNDFFTRLGQSLIHRADQALYSAKLAGRSRSAEARAVTWPPAAPGSSDELEPRSRGATSLLRMGGAV